MARFNNVDAPIGNIEDLTCNRVYADRVSANDYVGLPIASLIQHGIVKIDGTSIVINEEGIISARLIFDNESMESHIANMDIHMLPEDRNNLAILGAHISSSTLHFTFKEKESVLNDLSAAKTHISSPHFNEEEVNYLRTHVNESWMHFDDPTQKSDVLAFIKNLMIAGINTPNKFVITDASGNTTLSSVSSDILNYLPDLQIPLVDYLAEYFQEKGSAGNRVDLNDVYSHMQNTEVHMSYEEKKFIYDELEFLKAENEEGLLATKDDLLGLASNEHTHESIEITHNGRNLYAVLTEVISGINTIKGDIASIRSDIDAINQKINQYHPILV